VHAVRQVFVVVLQRKRQHCSSASQLARWHHPALMQACVGGQSASERHAVTHRYAPMQNEFTPKADSQSAADEQSLLHIPAVGS
jgi:hypothetical protein